jgi:hypothetical protein
METRGSLRRPRSSSAQARGLGPLQRRLAHRKPQGDPCPAPGPLPNFWSAKFSTRASESFNSLSLSTVDSTSPLLSLFRCFRERFPRCLPHYGPLPRFCGRRAFLSDRPRTLLLRCSATPGHQSSTSPGTMRSMSAPSPMSTSVCDQCCLASRFEANSRFPGTIGHVDHGKVRRTKHYIRRATNQANKTCRQPFPPPSPRGKPRRAWPTSSSMAPSTRPPRSGSVVSPSRLPTSSTRPRTGTTRTSTARATPITSRT